MPLVNAGQATTSAPGVAGPEVEACLARFALTLLFTPAATLKEAGHWGLLPRDCAAEGGKCGNVGVAQRRLAGRKGSGSDSLGALA